MKKNKHFSKFIKFVLYLLLFIILNSCARSGNPLRSDWLLTESQRDSAVFSKYHHYNIGTNFISTSDSLPLYSHLPGIVVLTNVSDTTIYLKEGMDFIVTGVIDPRWLNVNGEIYSYNVSNLQFALSGRGAISRNQNEGIFNRFVKYLF